MIFHAGGYALHRFPQGPGLENNAINSANPGHNSLGF